MYTQIDNHYNFQAMFRFSIYQRDKIFENNINNVLVNQLYSSFEIQNSLLDSCKAIIISKIVDKV